MLNIKLFTQWFHHLSKYWILNKPPRRPHDKTENGVISMKCEEVQNCCVSVLVIEGSKISTHH